MPTEPSTRIADSADNRIATCYVEAHAKFIVAWNELGKTEVDDAQWAAPSPYWLMQQLPGLKARPQGCQKCVTFSMGWL